MSEESKTPQELILEAVKQKRALVFTIGQQMKQDVLDKKLTEETVKHQHLALDNFEAALLEYAQGDIEKVLYFFGRGCWNLGEFKGRSDKERGLNP